jgi:SAM-dependent methyltransferase
MSPPADYAEEASIYVQLMIEGGDGRHRSLLELGCGGGNNASHFKHRFEQVTLTDLSPAMLALSRELNPDCEHIEGDMRTLRLGRQFDCVFVHDAVCYMTTSTDLRRAIETAYVHCRPGGVALFCPDYVRENFHRSTDDGGADGAERALRYLEWTWDPDPNDTTYTVDYAYMLRAPDGTVHVEHDRHIEGLFARADWLRLLGEVGFEARALPFEHSEVAPGSSEVFLARRP